MQTVYKWVEGILEEKTIALIDLDGWILFGWTIDIPEKPEDKPEEKIEGSRKRSTPATSTAA
jgi:hypothetical protein